MANRSGSRRHRIRSAALVVLGAFACDLGVEPPPDTPLLAVSAREVSLFVARGSGEPDVVTILISNNGRGTLSGLGVEEPLYVGGMTSDWLDASLQDSTLTLTARAVTTTGDTLETGSYEALVDVVADAAANSPRTITVNLLVGKSQQIALSVGGITFAAQATGPPPPHQTVTISNAGDGVLSELALDSIVYRDGEPDGWLDTALVRTRAPTGVELQPNSVPESEATLHATVFVGSRIADPPLDSIQVEYIVAAPPTLVLSATALALEAVEGDTTRMVHAIALRELNHRPLTGLTDAVSPNPGWLTSSRDGDDAPATLTITVDPTGLAGDAVYRDTVFVSSSAGDREEVAVSLSVRRRPTVHLSMDTVRFIMDPTGSLPGPQLVRLENSGYGTLSGPWEVGVAPPASWLSASLASATAPSAPCDTAPCDLVLAIVDTVGVERGTDETATVTVTGPGGSTAEVTVEFELLLGPSIVLSSESVIFRADSGQATADSVVLWVANGGDGVLTGLAVVDAPPWLSWSLGPDAPGELRLWPTTTDTVQQDYSGSVTLTSPVAGNDPVTVPLVYRVGSIADVQDSIAASVDSVGFTAVTTDIVLPTAVVGIASVGPDTVRNIRVSDNAAWLNATVENNDRVTPTRLLLSADIDGLDPGVTHRARVTVEGQSVTDLTIPVTLDLFGPEMVATSDRVVFRAYRGQTPLPDSQMVTVSNRASGTLQGVHFQDWPSWLTVTPKGPGLPAPAPLVMRPNVTDLAPPPAAHLEVVADGDDISPLPIEVRFEIDPGPALKLASDAIRLSRVEGSAEPDTVTVDLYNGGKGDLGVLSADWSQTQWLTATIDSSTVPARLVLVARADTLASRNYPDEVRVTATMEGRADLTADLAVTFAVAPQPEIQVSPVGLVFHASALTDSLPPQQTITVFDPAGGPSGQIAATSNATWLDIDVDSSTAPVTVVVRPNDVLDSRGSPYVDSVLVNSTVGTGVPQRVRVTYNIDVGRDPVIDLSVDRLEFRRPTSAQDVVPAQTVQIDNGGSRTLRELSVEDVTAGGPVDWLFVLLDSRVAPATLTVAIKPAEAAGTQRNEAMLEITGEDAEPRRLTVVLREGG